MSDGFEFRECLHLWWGPWSSKPVGGLKKAVSGFDSHTLPSCLFSAVFALFSGFCSLCDAAAAGPVARLCASTEGSENRPESAKQDAEFFETGRASSVPVARIAC